jgi:uncharacterized membrane protein YqjE
VNSSEVVNAQHNDVQHDDTSHSITAELINEIQQFVQTRADLFKAEIRQKLPHLLNAARMGLAGGLLLVSGYLFLALAVVVLIASAFPQNPYRWFFGFLIVGIVSVGFGAIGAFLAKSEFDLSSKPPERTLTVLKGDKDWMRSLWQIMRTMF